jgi:hypothetical protein
MTSPKTRAQLLAAVAARMKYTPDLFDQACKMGPDSVDKLDDATLALLVGPKRFNPEQIDLVLKIFPPERPAPNSDDPTKA